MTEVASRTGPVHTFTVFSDGTKREKNNQKTILRQEVKRLNAQDRVTSYQWFVNCIDKSSTECNVIHDSRKSRKNYQNNEKWS